MNPKLQTKVFNGRNRKVKRALRLMILGKRRDLKNKAAAIERI